MNSKATTATLVLSAIAGVIVAFIQSNIVVLEAGWNEGVTVALTVLAVWGISPLTGVAFRALLHLSNTASMAIAGALASLQIVLTQVHMSATAHGLLAGIIAFAAGLGFAPATGPVLAGEPKTSVGRASSSVRR